MSWVEIIVALAILVGIVGIVVPVLPGTIVVAAAVLIWASEVGGPRAWTIAGVAVTFLVLGAIVKYALPGRRLRSQGVPVRTLLLGSALGLIGFFVVPVIGLFLGFILGVYLAERHRLGATAAWPATKEALKAVGLSIAIELAAACLAAAVWAIGLTLT